MLILFVCLLPLFCYYYSVVILDPSLNMNSGSNNLIHEIQVTKEVIDMMEFGLTKSRKLNLLGIILSLLNCLMEQTIRRFFSRILTLKR